MLMIFDWDGTLSDSTGKIVDCVQAAAHALALPILPANEVQQIIGLSLGEAFRTLYPQVSDADHKRLINAYVEQFIEADAEPSAFFEGVEEGLARMKGAGLKLAVATGKSRKGLNRVLKNLGLCDFFDATRCADETAGKPDPMMLHELLAEFGVSRAHAVMVGDTTFDMAMAQSAGVRKVAVTYGAHAPSQLAPFSPDLCVDRFSQLLAWPVLPLGVEA